MSENPYTSRDTDKDTETFVRRLGDSAQQVWLAGLGAFNRAQAEGSRLFDSLVNEGRDYEQRHRDPSAASDGMRDSVQSTLGQARERSARTWNKMEQAFDDQVQGVLKRLNVPCRNDVESLERQLAALRQRLGELEGQFSRHQVRCQCGLPGSGTASSTSATSTPPHSSGFPAE